MDDLNILHMDEKEMLRIIEWMKIMYDEDIMVAQGNKHEYLVIDINLSIPLRVMVTMVDFNSQVNRGFPRGDNEDTPYTRWGPSV